MARGGYQGVGTGSGRTDRDDRPARSSGIGVGCRESVTVSGSRISVSAPGSRLSVRRFRLRPRSLAAQSRPVSVLGFGQVLGDTGSRKRPVSAGTGFWSGTKHRSDRVEPGMVVHLRMVRGSRNSIVSVSFVAYSPTSDYQHLIRLRESTIAQLRSHLNATIRSQGQEVHHVLQSN